MLLAITKLCCGISYPHVRNMAGLQCVAMVALGQEARRMPFPAWATSPQWCWGTNHRGTEQVEVEAFYREQGLRALQKAMEIVHHPDGWRKETSEDTGDIIYSKVLHGNYKVFRLEAELEGKPDELYDLLFVKIEEMHQWNPSIGHIKVLKRIGKETMVTHEVSPKRTGNLIGRRDFLSVRHSLKTEGCIYLGGAATQLETFPPQPGFVRAETGPTCIIIQCLPGSPGRSRFTWLLNMDVKVLLPSALVSQALVRMQTHFMGHLRRQLAANKDNREQNGPSC